MALGLSPLEELAEALLDFQSLADVQDWWQPWQEFYLPFKVVGGTSPEMTCRFPAFEENRFGV